jgi:IS30 family transposase
MASHLTLEEREVIAHMHRAGKTQTQIADRLGRHKSTVSRELRRNRSRNGYWAVAAQRKADRRQSERPWTAKMERPEVRRYVAERLRWRWSPDQIAGRSRSDFPDDRRRQISAPTIYAWIRQEQGRGKPWQRYLRRLGRKRPEWEKRGRLRAAVSIEGRPGVVDRRRRFGDWEGDTIVGANRRGGAVTLVERKSGYVLLGKVANLQAAALKIYFAKPYSAWQRGTNANTNGLIRQFFPKGTDLVSISDHQFAKVQQLLNDRPRKRLGYRTPNEVLASRLKGCI